MRATIDNMGQYSVSNLVNFAWFRTQGLADAIEAAGLDPEQVAGLVPVTLNGTFGEREVESSTAPMVTVEDDAFGVEWAFYAPADLVTIEWISGSGRSFATWGRFEREAVLTVSSDHLSIYILSALDIAIKSHASIHIMWTDDDETEAVRVALENELQRRNGRPSLIERLKPIQDAFAARPATGLKADKAFFDELNGEP